MRSCEDQCHPGNSRPYDRGILGGRWCLGAPLNNCGYFLDETWDLGGKGGPLKLPWWLHCLNSNKKQVQLHWLTIFSHLELVHRVCPFNMWKHGTKDNRKFKILPTCYHGKIFKHISDIFFFISLKHPRLKTLSDNMCRWSKKRKQYCIGSER